ncbi:DUF4342 domain-containing protein [Nonomuraea sp. NPDC048826]|uniref:DUF4342 domain-containing protein n=1 Tax=Nonomuraea sp. NPDC048826 TaxID=3364347 RepID=UPI003721A6D3
MTVTKERARPELTDRIKNVIHEGNVRRIIVKDKRGHTVMQVPVTVGVVALVFAPVVTALSAMGALAADWTIQVEKTDENA